MIRQYAQTFSGFNRNVRIYLFASSLIGFAIFGGIYPVLYNLFLLRLGYGPEFIGLVNAVILLGYALFSLPAGALSVRWGARRTMTAGMALIFVGYSLQPWAEIITPLGREPWLLSLGVVGALGLALFLTAANPLVTASTGPRDRTHAFAMRSALTLLAGFVGSLIAGGLPKLFAALTNTSLEEPEGYRWPLFLAALLLIPGIWATWRIQDVDIRQEHEVAKPAGGTHVAFVLLLGLADLLVLSSEGVARTFLNVYLDRGLLVSTSVIGMLFALAQLVAIPMALSTPRLVRRWGTGSVVAVCSLGMALALIPVALVPRWDVAGLSYIVVIVLAQIRVPAVGVYQMESVPPSWRGRMAGIAGLALGLSWAGTSMGGGVVIARVGYGRAFLVSAGITMIGSLIFASAARQSRSRWAS